MVSITAAIASVEFSKEFGRDAYFDSRVFNIPKDDVANYFLWRQLDAIRNGIQAAGNANFSPTQLHKLNTTKIKEKLLKEKNIDYVKDTPMKYQRGFCVIRGEKNNWETDFNIPIFSENPNYINRYL